MGDRELSLVSVTTWRTGVGGAGAEEGMYECLQLIHVVVWQKLIPYCKAIILLLKIM